MITADQYRQVLGQFPTGVIVVTATDADAQPTGMTVGSFTSVSLDPPLVAFLPSKTSDSWRALRQAGPRFCVNIMSADQEAACRLIATRKVDKFDGLSWTPSPHGNPVLDGSVAYIDCTLEDIHDAGDHHIVVGLVDHLEILSSTYPLLFFRGGYGSFRPMSLAGNDADLVRQLRRIDLIRPVMEHLADQLDTEVTAMCLVGDEIVIAAAAGRLQNDQLPTRVGQRAPFAAPVGSVLAAYGDEMTRGLWLRDLPADSEQLAQAAMLLERVRADGRAIAATEPDGDRPNALAQMFADRDPVVTRSTVHEALANATDFYNPRWLSTATEVELHTVSAPVLTDDGALTCALTAWGPQSPVPAESIEQIVAALSIAAQAAGRAVTGSVT